MHALSCRRGLWLGFLSIWLALASGCTLVRARQDLARLEALGSIGGTVAGERTPSKPACVALYAEVAGEAQKKLIAYKVIFGQQAFVFRRPAGTYYLFAFEDANEDGAFQPNERIGWHGGPTPLVLKPGETLADLVLELRPPEQARRELPLLYAQPNRSFEMKVESQHVGTTASLADPRFAPETGELGMWEPVAFFQQHGAGLFFLQPYAKDKIPVLFVHGVGGTPRNFGKLVEALDADRFQPWVLHYPSGLRLPLLSEEFARLLAEAQERFGFRRLIVVAHSMGGLVARDLVDRLAAAGQIAVPLFVSISTPWQGHPGAAMGVEHSPVILPCWYDMSPGSPFLAAMWPQPIPPGTAYYLLFGHRGGRAMMTEGNTDGTLPLASMLDLGMQEAAIKVFGFNETHSGILQSDEVAARLNHILTTIKD